VVGLHTKQGDANAASPWLLGAQVNSTRGIAALFSEEGGQQPTTFVFEWLPFLQGDVRGIAHLLSIPSDWDGNLVTIFFRTTMQYLTHPRVGRCQAD
jgi:hypothetical protein